MMKQIQISDPLSSALTKIKERMSVDLYFSLIHIFGFSFLDAPFHRNYANFIWDEERFPRQICLGPRGSGKSLISQCKHAVKFLLTPTQSTIYTSYNLETSVKNLDQTRKHILSSSLCRTLFPEVIADLERALDSRSAFKGEKATEKLLILATHRAGGSPNFKAASINSGITGDHFYRNFTDDLIDEINARSPVEIKRALDWFYTSYNILEHQTASPWQINGTHYNLNDPYVTILKEEHGFTPFVHPALMRIQDDDGFKREVSFWSSRFSVEDLYEMRRTMTPHRFAALMQQDPTQSEDSTFKEEDLQLSKWGRATLSGFPSIILPDGEVVFLENCNVFMVYDPAQGKEYSTARSAILVFAMDDQERIIILDSFAEKCTTNRAMKAFINRLHRWNPDLAAVEEVLFQDYIIPALKDLLPDGNAFSFPMKGVKPSGRSKDFRILALQQRFERKKIFVMETLDDFIMEFLSHPNGKFVDLLDCLAYGPDIWYPPRRKVENHSSLDYLFGKTRDGKPLQASQAMMVVKERDDVTGY